jgi:hypothetical protein
MLAAEFYRLLHAKHADLLDLDQARAPGPPVLLHDTAVFPLGLQLVGGRPPPPVPAPPRTERGFQLLEALASGIIVARGATLAWRNRSV